MSEANGTEQPASQTRNSVMESAGFLVGAALEVQKWSGLLDWSKRLVAEEVLATPELIEAFSKVRRVDFLPGAQKLDEGYDSPLKIGHNQTNSQPSLVGEMLELLKVRRGQSILDIGSGSGWTTALLASAVGSGGKVVGTERIAELSEFGIENMSRYGFTWASIRHTPDTLGFPSDGPYDRILVSAQMPEELALELSTQLSPDDGIMVAPISSNDDSGDKFNQQIHVFTRNHDEMTDSVVLKGVSFVPLVYDR